VGRNRKKIYDGVDICSNDSLREYKTEAAIACKMYLHFSALGGKCAGEEQKWKYRILTKLTDIKLFEGQAVNQVFSRRYTLYESKVPYVPMVIKETAHQDLLGFVMGVGAMSGPTFLDCSMQKGPDLVFFLQSNQELLPVVIKSNIETTVDYADAWASISREQIVKRLQECMDKRGENMQKEITKTSDEALKKEMQQEWDRNKEMVGIGIQVWKTRPLVRLLVLGTKYSQKKSKISKQLNDSTELMGVIDSETMRGNLMKKLYDMIKRKRDSEK